MAIYLLEGLCLNLLLVTGGDTWSSGNDEMVDPRIKDLHSTEIIRAEQVEGSLN